MRSRIRSSTCAPPSHAPVPLNIRGALCFPEPAAGLPLFGQLSVRGIIVDGPKPVAKLARRTGQLSPEAIESIWRHLARRLPQA